MKKLMALILSILIASINSCYAISELYYIKNVKTENLANLVEISYSANGYNLVLKNPYYGVKNEEAAIVILQQSGENLFYYYNSENNSKINKSILNLLKKAGINYEQSFNSNALSIYENIANNLYSSNGVSKSYNFEENTNVFTPPVYNADNLLQNSYRGYVAQVNAGTRFNVYLQSSINTATASKGDRVSAVLTENFSYNGKIIAPQGSMVYGIISKANHASYGSRNGRAVIKFNQIVTPDNQIYNITAEEIDFSVTNDGKFNSTAKSALSSAAVGALTGLLWGLLADNHNLGRSVLVGAGIGAGSSAIISVAEAGVDAEIPSFTEMEITLTKPLSVSINY